MRPGPDDLDVRVEDLLEGLQEVAIHGLGVALAVDLNLKKVIRIIENLYFPFRLSC